jgi:integrase
MDLSMKITLLEIYLMARGSIIARSGGYTIRYEMGMVWDEKKDAYGRKQKWEKVPWKKHKSQTTGEIKWVPPNKSDAQQLLAERLAQLNRGEFVEPSSMTFGQFKEEWMENYAEGEGEIRSSTLVLYRGFFKNHIIPAFGGKALSKITTQDIQAFKAKMLTSGKKVVKIVEREDGKKVKKTTRTGLSPQSVKHLIRLLRQMFEHAIDWGYLRTNPAKKVRLPKVPKKEMDYLNPEEVRTFLRHVPPRWYAFFLVAITTGLRVGELLGMRWDYVDWNLRQYFVKETWLRPRAGIKAGFSVPKTESSIARVDLTPTCLKALRKHKKRQAAEKLAIGEKYQDQGLIFATPVGGPLDDHHIIQRQFRPFLEAAGIRRSIRFHDLRHTCASLLIYQNESPKYIQKQLRHASIEITFDRYGHLFPETNKEAAMRLDETLFGTLGRVANEK